jgi:hypothetical protein
MKTYRISVSTYMGASRRAGCSLVIYVSRSASFAFPCQAEFGFVLLHIILLARTYSLPNTPLVDRASRKLTEKSVCTYSRRAWYSMRTGDETHAYTLQWVVTGDGRKCDLNGTHTSLPIPPPAIPSQTMPSVPQKRKRPSSAARC